MTRHRSNPSEKDRNKRAKRVKRDLTKILLAMEECNDMEDNMFAEMLQKRHNIKEKKRAAARNRKCRQRRSWAVFQHNLTDRQFRRYFRMERECFHYLCERIIENAGEGDFKSEDFLRDLKNGNTDAKFLHAHEHTTGGFVCGEVKLALTLRLLAGGSYLDLALLFEVGFSTAYEIFHKVIKDWILDDRLVKINGIDYCEDDERMSKVALDFATASNGILNSCIGAIDGWIVKIRKPSITKDLFNMSEPGTYFSRKGFYGINVQAIVDRKKHILYRNIINRGAEHDSTAFKNSTFYTWLMDNWKSLAEKGFYFIGDSAYAIKSFVVTPFDNAVHGTPEDNFNFFHSSSRISVECTFGEIDLRWGILWRPLQFRLKHNVNIIDACMRLHNLIVDRREEKAAASVLSGEMERSIFDEDHRRFMAVYPSIDSVGVHGGEEDTRLDSNGNPLTGGRPTNVDKSVTALGRNVRHALCDDMARKKLVRPKINWFRSNNRVLD